MKKLKEVFSRIFIMVCVLMVFAVNTETVSAAETVTVGDWTYSIENGIASVKSYNGKSTSVTIPTSATLNGTKYKITKVGEKAFADNTTLKQVYIPAEIKTLDKCAFKNCTSLSYVEIQGDLADCNYLASYSANADDYAVFYNTGTNADSFVVTIKDGVTKIPAYLFATAGEYGCRVTEVVMADSVREIGESAFYNCKDLKSVEMGAGLTTLADYSFKNCTSLKAVVIPSKVTSIGKEAFGNCSDLLSVELPEKDCAIGVGAFKNCTSLNSVMIKSNINDCNYLASYSANADDYAVFYNTGTNADSFVVTIKDGVTKIPAYLFATAGEYGCHITEVAIADSVKEIGEGAFYNCKDLKSIQLGAGLTTVESKAFYNCVSLSKVQMNQNLATIGSYAFAYTSLAEVALPEKVSVIGEKAFLGCASLKKVDLPKNQCNIGIGAFKDCTVLNSVVINGDYGDCNSGAANYYNVADYAVFCNAGSNADFFVVTVNEGVTRIPAYLFASAAGKEIEYGAHITKVVLADTVEEIGKYAFYNCVDLAEINLNSASLPTIGEAAFQYDTKIGEVTLLSGVGTIGKNAFADCSNLTIRGLSGSTAETYAAQNGIPFVRVEGWLNIRGINYWHEGGYRQGTYDDSKGVLGDGTVRGREIYDPISDGWYWLDAVYDGAKAVNKEVWMPYIYQNEADWGEEEIRFNAEASGDMAEQVIREINNRTGKWVRYDAEGKMYKGWYTVEGADASIYPNQVGNTYYYDQRTGLMAKGEVEIDGVVYYFDPITGVLQ